MRPRRRLVGLFLLCWLPLAGIASQDESGLAETVGRHIRTSDTAMLDRRYDAASQAAIHAVGAARAAGDDALLAAALTQLGNVHLSTGDTDAALRGYRGALNALGPAADSPASLPVRINSVHALRSTGDHTGARDQHERAMAIALAWVPAAGATDALLALGHLAQGLAERDSDASTSWLSSAHRAFTAARDNAARHADPLGAAYAHGHLGELYQKTDRPGEALQSFRRAVFLADESDAAALRARWWWRIGQVRVAQGETAEALAAYRQSLDALDPIRPELGFDERGYPNAVADSLRQRYLEYARLLIDTLPGETPAAGPTLRAIRTVMEDLKAVKLENHYRDHCVIEQRQRNRAVDIDTLLSPGTAILYPVVFDDRLVLILSLPDGAIDHAMVPVGAEEIASTAARFRALMSPASNPRRLLTTAGQLYDWLIRPISAKLAGAGIDTLVTVPDGALRTVPFAALHDGREFLVQRMATVVSPGVALTPAPAARNRSPRLLAAGLSDAVQGFTPLPHVDEELDALEARFGGRLLRDQAFVTRTLREALETVPYDIIAFATHAHLDADPTQSYVLTHDGRLGLDALADLVRISEFRSRPVEMIVLSACNTAIGDERAALGLAGIALKSGARSAMASLWAVNDSSTARLVPDFVSRIGEPGINRAQALQHAQLGLLREPGTSHPYHWAAFILVGNWQ